MPSLGWASIGLAIYLAAGILYFFARSMVALIVVSCLLGCGCGLVIPLAAGLIADTFVGKYRMQQLGIKSGISNMALVLATFVVGWLNRGNWHMPFLVYITPAIPLVLMVFVRRSNLVASVKMNHMPPGVGHAPAPVVDANIYSVSGSCERREMAADRGCVFIKIPYPLICCVIF